jgi:hypothetical protein
MSLKLLKNVSKVSLQQPSLQRFPAIEGVSTTGLYWILPFFSESNFIAILTSPVTTANEVIACLKAAGIVFVP